MLINSLCLLGLNLQLAPLLLHLLTFVVLAFPKQIKRLEHLLSRVLANCLPA